MVNENAAYNPPPQESLLASARKLWQVEAPTQTEQYWRERCEQLQQQLAEARTWDLTRWKQERDQWFAEQNAKADEADMQSAPQRAEYDRQLRMVLELLETTPEGNQLHADLTELEHWLMAQLQRSEIALAHRPSELGPKMFGAYRLEELGAALRHAEYQLRQTQENWEAVRVAEHKIARVRDALDARSTS